tara:strand:- start:28055 stop:29599 length:1545 start_codon:yes stop_codon:yes gene_type:complete
VKGLRPGEWLIVVLLLLSILLFSAAFVFEQNRSSGQGSGDVIGELNFRYRIAERKFADSVLWDRINPGDELHNQDWIRTDSYSEAVLELEDGSTVEMAPETMLVLIVDEGRREIRLEKGSLELNLKQGFDLISEDRRIVGLRGESRISKNADSLEIEQKQPGATFNGQALPVWSKLSDGQVVAKQSELVPLAPVDNRTVMKTAKIQVKFRWSGSCPCSLHLISPDSGEGARVIKDLGNEYELSLGPGIYSWYVQNENGASPRRSFRLLEEKPIQALQPVNGAQFTLAGQSGLVQFGWDAPGFSKDFLLQVSKNPDMSAVIHSRSTQKKTAVLSLSKGTYYWRITSLAGIPDETDSSAALSSDVLSFEVKPREEGDKELAVKLEIERNADKPEQTKVKETAQPTYRRAPRQWNTFPVFPAPNASVDMSARDSLPFRWTPVTGAEKYLFRLYRDDSILIERFVQTPYLNFTELTLLDTAWFKWSVEPIFGDARSGTGFEHRFQVTLSEQLEKPELE